MGWEVGGWGADFAGTFQECIRSRDGKIPFQHVRSRAVGDVWAFRVAVASGGGSPLLWSHGFESPEVAGWPGQLVYCRILGLVVLTTAKSLSSAPGASKYTCPLPTLQRPSAQTFHNSADIRIAARVGVYVGAAPRAVAAVSGH